MGWFSAFLLSFLFWDRQQCNRDLSQTVKSETEQSVFLFNEAVFLCVLVI